MSLSRSLPFAAGVLLSAVALTGAVSCSKNDTTQTGAPSATSGPGTTTSTTAAATTTSTSDASTSKTTSTTSDVSSATTTTTGLTSAADLQAAQAALITVSDVPAGFTESPSASSDSANPFAGVPECAAYVQMSTTTDALRTAKAKVTFKDAAKDEIAETNEVYPDVATVQTIATAFADPSLSTCLQAAFTSGVSTSLPAGATLGTVSVAPGNALASAASLGVDAANALIVQIPITANGKTVTLYSGLVFLSSGRMTAGLSVQTTGSLDATATIAAAAAKLKANAPT